MIDDNQFSEEDKQVAEQLDKELRQLEKGIDIPLSISPIAAWCLILQIQLLGRHPHNQNWVYATIENFAHQLEDCLVMSEWLRDYTARGWNPEFDLQVSPNEKSEKSLKFLNSDSDYIAIDKRAFLLNNSAYYMVCSAFAKISGEDPVAVAESVGNYARENILKMSDVQVEETIKRIVENCDSQGLLTIPVYPPDESTRTP